MASILSPNKVWLITGCSSGIGRELALAALARGDRVIATARSVAKLDDLAILGAHPLVLDVTWSDAVLAKSVALAVDIYGRIDVLVNNAGYILRGGMEECSASEVQEIFNTNVFGVLSMTRAVLPYMRAQKSGMVANIGSIFAWRSHACTGMYCATKFAVAGITEALREEVAHLGIDVISIDLGAFRTEIVANTVLVEQHIPDFDPVLDPVRQFLATFHGKQPGDPAKAAQLIVEILTKSGRAENRTLPPRLAMGEDAVAYIKDAIARNSEMLAEWGDLVSTTNVNNVV